MWTWKKHIELKNADFQLIYRHGKSVANRQFVVYTYQNQIAHFRLGISVSKKIGNAVIRNKIKRAIREILKYTNKILLPKTSLLLLGIQLKI